MKSPLSVSSSVLLLTPSGAKLTDSEGQFLAVHYMHLCRIRHWVSQEVFLDPNLLIIKVYAAISNIGIDFIPSSYPSAEVFAGIPLPAAFIEGQPEGTRGILRYLRSIVDIDQDIRNSYPEERAAIECGASTVLSDAIEYALYGHGDCYTKFTCPVMRDSLSRIYVDSYLSSQRTKWINRDNDLISGQLWRVIKEISRKLGWTSGRKFLFDDRPSVCDISLYSYLSILFSIPENLTPYEFLKHDQSDQDIEETVQRIKSYLLDFDDWLWQLNTTRSNESAGLIPLLPSAAKAAKGVSSSPVEEDEEENTETEQVNRPFLGKDSDVRKSNVIFLSVAAVSMIGIGLLI